uniref:AlNc14C369G11082 protein n=1 Tax=Albugo laibachii Nc14 TaxID=890382 RepID=F0WY36_9STRA|nr:AlNc14C369G11082 [Albugo laibachii Nc14]|eukprot:CCA26385.1 AlNc14C369G11082 [Albugo laibachii Nc14]
MRTIEIAEEADVDGFLGSWPWHRAFVHRDKMSIQIRTRQDHATTGEADAAIRTFSELMLHTKERLGVSKEYSADQTAISFESLPKHTISARGTKTVWLRHAGKDNEELTVILFGDSDGNK